MGRPVIRSMIARSGMLEPQPPSLHPRERGHHDMGTLNSLGWRDRLGRGLVRFTRRRLMARSATVEWISYHVPKTAGTSFRVALVEAFGPRRVFAVYDGDTGVLTRGEPIWLPSSGSVVHGHFRPHARHQDLFPRGKRIVWLRDPVERAWSLFNHTLDVRNNRRLYDHLKTRYLDAGMSRREEIFKAMLRHEVDSRAFMEYEGNYQSFDRSFFFFVGCSDRYREDLTRLSELMQTPLPIGQFNTARSKQPPPTLDDRERAAFSEEYRVFERLIRA